MKQEEMIVIYTQANNPLFVLRKKATEWSTKKKENNIHKGEIEVLESEREEEKEKNCIQY